MLLWGRRHFWPPFAKSEEGLEIAALSQLGIPLAQTQAEMTPAQKIVLGKGLEELYQRAKSKQSSDLRQKVIERKGAE